MKHIKNRSKFINERKGSISPDALHVLASNDQNQSPDIKEVLDDLDKVNTDAKVITRIAPSPTGFAHIGFLRTALYNYLFAKKHNGIFYVRIEDTDQKRFVKEAEEYIKNALEWCGLIPDWAPWIEGSPNGPYRQSERDYTKEIKTLLNNGNAYYAFDTEKDLTEAREKNPNFSYSASNRMSMNNSLSLSKEDVDRLLSEKHPYVIRFKVEPNKTIIVDDIIRGKVQMNTNQTDDKVLIKSNGIPTYHFANVCDDHNMGTTHVIRGDEWLPSAPLHLMLYNAFGWIAPQFAHLPVILNPDGKGKLSKRKALSLGIPAFPFGGKGLDDKGQEVEYKGFKDEGFEPDALLNFLVMLGWSAKDDKELLTMADMISEFSLDRVHKAGARYDIAKAKFFNQSYINNFRSEDELLKHIDFGSSNFSPENKSKIIDIAKKRSVFVKDMQSIVDIFTQKVSITSDMKRRISEEFKSVVNDIVSKSKDIEWKDDSIKQMIFDICESKSIKMGKIMPSLRILLTGDVPGPDLMTTSEILGRDEFINRISNL